MERCRICNKFVWFWQDKEYLEMTPDFGYSCHKNCFNKEDYKREMNKWLKEIGIKEVNKTWK